MTDEVGVDGLDNREGGKKHNKRRRRNNREGGLNETGNKDRERKKPK